jgi:hypothetical protein
MSNAGNTAQLLGYAILNLMFWGIVLSAAAVAINRRFGPRWVWRGWILVVLILTLLGTVVFHRSFTGDVGAPATTIYMLGMFIGIPTGAIALVSSRVNRRLPPRSWIAHLGLTLGAFVTAIPVALVVGSIPDIARMF